MSDDTSPKVSVGTLAAMFDLTAVRIQQLAKLGVVVKMGHGQYDLFPSVKNYVAYVQGRRSTSESEDSSPDDYHKHRTRLTKAKAEREELELAKAKGTVHEGTAVERVWTDGQMNCRSRLLALPPSYAPRLAGAKDEHEIQAILEVAINEALNELADYDPSRISDQAFSEVGPSVATSPEKDGK